MFSSQVAGAGRVAEVDVQTIGTTESLLATAEANRDKLAILVDLGVPGLDVDSLTSLARSLREIKEDAKLIAIGPHVHAEKLTAAEESGFDFVLTKGQASRELSALLADLKAV
jgi:CheY-like chemotaxis protein